MVNPTCCYTNPGECPVHAPDPPDRCYFCEAEVEWTDHSHDNLAVEIALLKGPLDKFDRTAPAHVQCLEGQDGYGGQRWELA
jgi:hypothetical protein